VCACLRHRQPYLTLLLSGADVEGAGDAAFPGRRLHRRWHQAQPLSHPVRVPRPAPSHVVAYQAHRLPIAPWQPGSWLHGISPSHGAMTTWLMATWQPGISPSHSTMATWPVATWQQDSSRLRSLWSGHHSNHYFRVTMLII